VKDWEIIADNLGKAEWSLGWALPRRLVVKTIEYQVQKIWARYVKIYPAQIQNRLQPD
jgi:hypothetical protein